MSNFDDLFGHVNDLNDGDCADFYDKPPGLFGRLFQEPDWTAVRSGDSVDMYDGPPGIFGRLFQQPQATIKDTGHGCYDVYEKPPGMFGRFFQVPDRSVRVRKGGWNGWLSSILW